MSINIKFYAFAILAFLIGLGGFFVLSSCSKDEGIGSFNIEEKSMSIDESFNINHFFKGNADGVEFVSSNPDVVSIENNIISTVKGGSSFISAFYEEVEIDSFLVVVKNRYSAPSNLKMSNTGMISWQEVYGFENENQVEAEYVLSITTGGETQEVSLEENYYQLQYGEYQIKIAAKGTENIDGSGFGSIETFNFFKMPSVQGLKFENIEEQSVNFENNEVFVNLTWDAMENAEYEVWVEGVIFKTQQNSITIPVHNLENGEFEARVWAISCGAHKFKSDPVSLFINKEQKPQYVYDEGKIKIQNGEKDEYKIIYQNTTTNDIKSFLTTDNCFNLDNVDPGLYAVKIQKISESGCNSSFAVLNKNLAKINPLNLSYEISGEVLKVKVSCEDAILKNALLTINDKQGYVRYFEKHTLQEVSDGVFELSLQINLGGYFDDEYFVNVKALADSEGANYVIESNNKTENFFVIDSAKNIIHSIKNESNALTYENHISTIAFDNVENADKFNLFVNDQLINESDYEIVIGEEKTTINILLNRNSLGIDDGEQVEFKINALREDEKAVVSESVKVINIMTSLQNPSINGSSVQDQAELIDEYAWENKANASWTYELTKFTDSTFSTIENSWGVEKINTNKNKIEDLDLGFYGIKLWESVVSQGEFLTAKNSYIEDRFIVSENLNCPNVSFAFDKSNSNNLFSGYYLEIENVSNATGFKIDLIDPQNNETTLMENVPASVAATKTYNFQKNIDFKTAGDYVVKITAINTNDVGKFVYWNSSSKNLEITRFDHPKTCQIAVDDDNNVKIMVQKLENVKDIIVAIDNEVCEKENDWVDVTKYKGEFIVKVKNKENKEYEENDIYFLESVTGNIMLKRVSNPKNINHNDGEITFAHDESNGKAEKFVVYMNLTTVNNETETFRFETNQNQTNDKKFLIEELVQDAIANNLNNFNYYYQNRKSMTLSIVAYLNEPNTGYYSIPSTKEESGESTVVVNQSKKVEDLSFNKEQNKLEWSFENDFPESEEINFEIFLFKTGMQNFEKIATVSSYDEKNQNRYSYSYEITESFNTSTIYRYVIITQRPNFWKSTASNYVNVQKLSSVESLKYTDSKVGFDIVEGEKNGFKHVRNNSEISTEDGFITCQAGENKIVVVGKDSLIYDETTHVYLDSDAVLINLVDINSINYSIDQKKENQKISWTKIPDQVWSGVTVDGISNLNTLFKYKFEIYGDGELIKSVVLNECEIVLNHEIFHSLSSGVYDIKVTAFVDNYNISKGGKGIFGEKVLFENFAVEKLENVKNSVLTIDENQSTILNEQSKSLEISWDFNGTSSDVVTYQVILNEEEEFNATTKILNIPYSSFKTGINKIWIYAISDKDISSTFIETEIEKLESPVITLNNSGVVEVSSPLSASFLIEVDLKDGNGIVASESFTINTNNCDLNSFINDNITNLELDWQVELKTIALSSNQAGNKHIASGVSFLNKKVLENAHNLIVEDNFIKIYHNKAQSIQLEINDEIYNTILTNDNGHKCFIFEIPVAWISGIYNAKILIENSSENYVSNKNQTYVFEIQKGNALTEIQVERLTNEKNDIQLAGFTNVFGSVEKIEVKLFKNEVFAGTKAYETSVLNMAEIAKAIGEDTGLGEGLVLENKDFLAGNYRMEFVVFGNTETDKANFSQIIVFNFEVKENDISSVRVDDYGYLIFESSEQNQILNFVKVGDYFVNHINQKRIDLSFYYVSETDNVVLISNKGEDYSLSQNINLENQTVVLDSPYSKHIFNNFMSEKITATNFDNNGLLEVKIDNEKVFVKHGNNQYEIPVYTKNEKNYIRNFEVYEALGFDQSVNEQILIYKTRDDSFKSQNTEVLLNINKIEDINFKKSKDANNVESFVEFEHDDFDATAMSIKINYINNLNQEVLLVDDVFDTNENVVNLSAIISNFDETCGAGLYKIKMAPVMEGKISNEKTFGSAIIQSYARLSQVDKFDVGTDGEIFWRKLNEEYSLNSYYISYTDGVNVFVQKTPKNSNYVLSSTILHENKNYNFDIFSLSDSVDVLTSKVRSLSDVEKLGKIDLNNIDINNGVMYLKYGDKNIDAMTSDEVYASGDFVKILRLRERDRLTYNEFLQKLRTIKFKSPFAFTLQDFTTVSFENCLRVDFKTGSNNEKLNISINDLLEKIDPESLEILKEIELGTNGLGGNSQLNNMINWLENEENFAGVASDLVMFDDIANGGGESVSAGVFDLEFSQIGKADNCFYESSGIKLFKTVNSAKITRTNTEVVAAPTTIIASEENFIGDTLIGNKYMIKFTPVKDAYNNLLTKYNLIFKQEKMVEYKFNVSFESGVWSIKNENNPDAGSIELETEGTSVVIPLNSCKGQTGIDTLVPNSFSKNLFKANVYAVGNDGRLNSKSDNLTIGFLDFNTISSTRGELYFDIFTLGHKNFSTRTVSKKSNQVIPITEVLLRNRIDFKELGEGSYDYLTFMTQGEVCQTWEAYVDSEIYYIENLFKLYSPDASVKNGEISVSKNSRNQAYQNIYEIKNNEAQIEDDKNDLAFVSNDVSNNEWLYETGVNDYVGDFKNYKDTEKQAESFYIRNAGSNVSVFTKEESLSFKEFGNAKKLTHDQNLFVFRSNQTTINAQMLQTPTLFINESGDVAWTSVGEREGLLIEVQHKIIYKVEVEYYYESQTSNGVEIVKDSTIETSLHTENNFIESEKLLIPELDKKYYYRIIVQANIYSETDNGNANVSTDKKDYYIINDGKYAGTEINVLKSEQGFNSSLFERLSPVYGLKIEQGSLIYNNDQLNTTEIVRLAKNRYSEKFDADCQTVEEGSKRICEVENDLEVNEGYFVYIKTIDNTNQKISSQEIISNNEYFKLPAVQREDIKIKKLSYTDGAFDFDFSRVFKVLEGVCLDSFINVEIHSKEGLLFENINVSNNNPTIRITTQKGESDELRKRFFIDSKEFSLVVYMQSGSSLVLNSSKTEHDFDQSNFSKHDTLAWNQELLQFEWTLNRTPYLLAGANLYTDEGLENSVITIAEKTKINDLEFKENIVQVEHADQTYFTQKENIIFESQAKEDLGDYVFDVYIESEEIISESEKVVTTRTYYEIKELAFCPDVIGEIVDFKVFLRNSKKGLSSDPLEFGEVVYYAPFEKGSGVCDNPYVVKTAQHLNNLGFKNHNNESLYDEKIERISVSHTGISTTTILKEETDIRQNLFVFNQSNDIDLGEVETFIVQDFKSNYDGKGFKITYFSSATTDITNEQFYKNVGFNKGVSLFENNSGEISNLLIDFSFSYQPQTQNVVVAGLALQNTGLMQNVNISALECVFEQGITNDTAFGFAGLTAFNKGEILECDVLCAVEITNNKSIQTGSAFFFGGLALTNTSTIDDCKSLEEMILDFKNVANSFALHVSKIVCLNTGYVENSQGQQEINIVSNGSVLVAGVAFNNSPGIVQNTISNCNIIVEEGRQGEIYEILYGV